MARSCDYQGHRGPEKIAIMKSQSNSMTHKKWLHPEGYSHFRYEVITERN